MKAGYLPPGKAFLASGRSAPCEDPVYAHSARNETAAFPFRRLSVRHPVGQSHSSGFPYSCQGTARPALSASVQ